MIDEEEAKRGSRVYDFLATCDTDDLCILSDSAALNDIFLGYLKLAMEKAGVEEESRKKVLSELCRLFDEVSAKEVLEKLEEKRES